MNDYLKAIDKQFECNRGKNILFDADTPNLSFVDEIRRLLVNQANDLAAPERKKPLNAIRIKRF